MLTRIAECLIDLSDVRHVCVNKNGMRKNECDHDVFVTFKDGNVIAVAQNRSQDEAKEIVNQIQANLQGEG